MSTEIMNFSFEGADVRVNADEHGNPWFVGKDVCNCWVTKTKQTH